MRNLALPSPVASFTLSTTPTAAGADTSGYNGDSGWFSASISRIAPIRSAARAARTGHVQIADNPGRGAPGTGTLPLEELLEQLRKAGYEGYVGLEYKPGERPSSEAFEWLPAAARAAR